MEMKSIYTVREELDSLLRSVMEELHRSRGAGSKASGARSLRVVVTVNPGNDIDVMVVSPVFDSLEFESRRDLVWPVVERHLSVPERNRIDRFELLTVNEARMLYPSTLKARSPFVPVR